MKVSNPLFYGLFAILTLSACGVQSTRKAVDPVKNDPSTAGQQTAFKNEEVERLSTHGKCRNLIPVEVAPEGFKEVALDKIGAGVAKGTVYQLVSAQANAVVLTSDQRVISGTTSSLVEGDKLVQSVECKDLAEGDEIEMPQSPVWQLNAQDGSFERRAGFHYVLKADADEKKTQLTELKAPVSYYNFLAKIYPKDRAAAKARGEDLMYRAYKDKDGNLEIRMAQLKPTKVEAQKLMYHVAVRYQLRVAPKDGAIK